MENKNNITLNLKISGINEADAISLIKMFKFMEYCGNVGHSTTVSYLADGDGSFRPKVEYKTDKKINMDCRTPLELNIWRSMKKGTPLKIDSDYVAWCLPNSDGTVDGHLKEESEKEYDEFLANGFEIIK